VFFIADKKPDVYAIVQSCIARDSEQDSILLQCWEKEYIRSLHQSYAPVLHVVPVESFGEHVLVVEDDSAVRESINQKNIEPGCTLVLPRQEYWAKPFLSIKIKYIYNECDCTVSNLVSIHFFIGIIIVFSCLCKKFNNFYQNSLTPLSVICMAKSFKFLTPLLSPINS